jgi:hypothetical protein
LHDFNPYAEAVSQISNKKDSAKERQNEAFRDLIKRAGIEDAEKEHRLHKLFDYWNSSDLRRMGRSILDTIRLVEEAPAVTQLELDRILDVITASKIGKDDLEVSLAALQVPRPEGLTLIAKGLAGRYTSEVDAALRAFSVEEQRIREQKAAGMVDAFTNLAELDLRDVEESGRIIFSALYGAVRAHRSNAGKRILAAREDELLGRIIAVADDRSIEQIETLVHDDDHLDFADFRHRTDLARKVIGDLAPRIAALVLRRFRQPGVVNFLQALPYRSIYVRILADPKGILWRGQFRDQWLSLLSEAAANEIVRKNLLEVLSTLESQLAEYVSIKGERTSLLSNSDTVRLLWNAALSAPVTIFWQYEFLPIRAQLIGRRVPEEAVVIPDWFADDVKGLLMKQREAANTE